MFEVLLAPFDEGTAITPGASAILVCRAKKADGTEKAHVLMQSGATSQGVLQKHIRILCDMAKRLNTAASLTMLKLELRMVQNLWQKDAGICQDNRRRMKAHFLSFFIYTGPIV